MVLCFLIRVGGWVKVPTISLQWQEKIFALFLFSAYLSHLHFQVFDYSYFAFIHLSKSGWPHVKNVLLPLLNRDLTNHFFTLVQFC